MELYRGMVQKIHLKTLQLKIVHNDKDLINFEKLICSLSRMYGLGMFRCHLRGLQLFDIQRFWIVEWKSYYDLYVPISPKRLFDWLTVKVGMVSFEDMELSCDACGLCDDECMTERHYNTCIVLSDEIRLEV